MKRRYLARIILRLSVTAAISGIICLPPPARAEGASLASQSRLNPAGQNASSEAERNLQTGITLTREGHFLDAIPHFLAARGRVSDEYAVDFNLALCYVATNQFTDALQVLQSLKNDGYATADVHNLLAQTYIGLDQPRKAFGALEQAAAQNPRSEKLYLFVADACMSHGSYGLGVKVVNLGLQHFSRSARLHYERGMFLASLDQPDLAKTNFKLASKLARGSDIYYMAEGQADLLGGNISGAVRITREGIQKGHENSVLLAIYGGAVLSSGAGPGQPEFAEAEAALEKSVAERPNSGTAQLALGELYLTAGRLDDAIAHLDKARQFAPKNASVYSHLALAYRRRGEIPEAQKMLATLAKLNEEQVAKYKLGSPDHKGGYTGSAMQGGIPPDKPRKDN